MRLEMIVSLPVVGLIAMAGFALRTTVDSSVSVSFDLTILTMYPAL
jgi:hypothetical protein